MAEEILIIEDDIVNQLVIKKLLQKKSISTFEAENGQVGIDILKSNPGIKHIVLDLNLPVMDGYAFIEYINAHEEFKHVKIYIMSCYTQSAFNAKMTNRHIGRSQVVSYYEKPLAIQEMVEFISANAGHS